MTVALLPNGKQQFIDGDGAPLAGGKVYFYVPNTSPPEFKDTWEDIDQSTINPNPVVLDADGRWPIWGSGVYRQVLYDQNDVLIWDQTTSSGEDTSLTQTYDFAVFMEGRPEAAELYPVFSIVRNLSLPADLTGTQVYVQSSSLPTAAIVITLQQNNIDIGTIGISSAGVVTIVFASVVHFAAGDRFSVVWPTVQDLTAANISITFIFDL